MINGIARREALTVQTYMDCIFLPYNEQNYSRGLYDSSGHFVKNSGARISGGGYVTEKKTLPTGLFHTNEISEPVVFVGYLPIHYGHFLVDAMIRFWPFLSETEMGSYRIVISHYRHAKEVPSYVYELMERITGRTRDSLLIVKSPVRLTGKVLVPEWSYVPEQYISPWFQKTFDKVADGIPPDGVHRKLYLSRRRLNIGRAHEYGERAIEEIMSENGYEILYPETMSLSEQISRYRAADVLVSTNGTLAHNILWCRKGCRQIIIKRLPDTPMHQEAINAIRDASSVKVIDCCDKEAEHDLSLLHISREFRTFLKEENYVSKYSKGLYFRDCAAYRIRRFIRSVRNP